MTLLARIFMKIYIVDGKIHMHFVHHLSVFFDLINVDCYASSSQCFATDIIQFPWPIFKFERYSKFIVIKLRQFWNDTIFCWLVLGSIMLIDAFDAQDMYIGSFQLETRVSSTYSWTVFNDKFGGICNLVSI